MVKNRSTKQSNKKWLLFILLTVIILLFAIKFLTDTQLPIFQQTQQTASIDHGWNLILVNQDNPLPKDYKIELTVLSNGQSVDERIYPHLQEMFDNMRSEGKYPIVASGYRTHERQQEIMHEKVQAYRDEGY